jgi:hypothetical protein
MWSTSIYSRVSCQLRLRRPGRLIYNYLRDGYDPAVGRYTQPDPLLQLNRHLTGELAFLVPGLVRTPAWLHPYSYVTAQPLLETDALGLGPIRYLKCWWKVSKLDQFAEQCRTECGDDIMQQLRFLQKYDSVSISAAQIKCVCTRAAAVGKGSLCATWASDCTGAMAPSWY